MSTFITNHYYGCCPPDVPPTGKWSVTITWQIFDNSGNLILSFKSKNKVMILLKPGQFVIGTLGNFVDGQGKPAEPEAGSFAAEGFDPDVILVEQDEEDEKTFKFTGVSSEEGADGSGKIVFDGDSGEGVSTIEVPVDFSADNWDVVSASMTFGEVQDPETTEPEPTPQK